MRKKSNLKLVPSNEATRTATPKRLPNSAYCAREYLERLEVQALRDAAKKNRCGIRDACVIWMAYIHGLRASELVRLQWSQMGRSTPTAARTGRTTIIGLMVTS